MEPQSLVEDRKNWRVDGEMEFIYHMLHINPLYIIYMFLRALDLHFLSCAAFGGCG